MQRYWHLRARDCFIFVNFCSLTCVNVHYIFKIVFLFLFNPQQRTSTSSGSIASVMMPGKVDGRANHEHARVEQNRGIEYTERGKSRGLCTCVEREHRIKGAKLNFARKFAKLSHIFRCIRL